MTTTILLLEQRENIVYAESDYNFGNINDIFLSVTKRNFSLIFSLVLLFSGPLLSVILGAASYSWLLCTVIGRADGFALPDTLLLRSRFNTRR